MTIPPDLVEKAREIVDSFSFESDVVRGWWYEEITENLTSKIALAILAERERCAKMFDKYGISDIIACDAAQLIRNMSEEKQ